MRSSRLASGVTSCRLSSQRLNFDVGCDMKSRNWLSHVIAGDRDATRCSATGTLPGRAGEVIPRYEALGTMKPVKRSLLQESKPRGALNFCQHQGGKELGFAVWSTQVNRCSAVTENKPKVLIKAWTKR
jgi:hypothetical protein